MDVFQLKPGEDYNNLKPLYVIFICNFDPFGAGRYYYEFEMYSKDADIPLQDGAKRIFLSTEGNNPEEVPKALVDFLGYIKDSSDEHVEKADAPIVKQLHERVKSLKKNRVMEERFMWFEEFLQDEKRESKAEGKSEGRSDILTLIQRMVENGEQDAIPTLYEDEEFSME